MFARGFTAAIYSAITVFVLAACGGGTLGEEGDGGLGDGGNGGAGAGELQSISLTPGDVSPRAGDLLRVDVELSGTTDEVVSGVEIDVELEETGERQTVRTEENGREGLTFGCLISRAWLTSLRGQRGWWIVKRFPFNRDSPPASSSMRFLTRSRRAKKP